MHKHTFLQRFHWLDVVLTAGILFLMFFIWRHADQGNAVAQEWQWERMHVYFAYYDAQGWHAGLLLKGLMTTLRLGVWSGILALSLGLVAGVYLADAKPNAFTYALDASIIFLRNTPPLVLLFLLYFLGSESTFSFFTEAARSLPPWAQKGLTIMFASPDTIDRMLAAVCTLGCYQGAYVAEIFRAGLQSLPQGQSDAAKALGLSRNQQWYLVLLPQSLPIILPPLAGQCISIFKDSALASLISVPELTFQGMEIMAITRLPFEIWIIIAVLYWLISFVCSQSFGYMERSLSWHKSKGS